MRVLLIVLGISKLTAGMANVPPAGVETYLRVVDDNSLDDSAILLEAEALVRYGQKEGSCAHAQTGLALQFAAHLGMGAEVSEALLRKDAVAGCDSSTYTEELWHSIGNYRLALGQISSAERAFHAALSKAEHPELQRRIMNSLAGCSWRRQDFEQTWSWMNRAWEVDSLHAPGYLVNNLLAISLLSGHIEQAARQAEIFLAHTAPEEQVIPFIKANLLQARLQLYQTERARTLVHELPWKDLLVEEPIETTKTAFQVAIQLGIFAPVELSRAYWQGDEKPYAELIRKELGWRALARDPEVLPLTDLPRWAEHIPMGWDGVWGMPDEAVTRERVLYLLPMPVWWGGLVGCAVLAAWLCARWLRMRRVRRVMDADHEEQRRALVDAITREQRPAGMELLKACYLLAAGWIQEPLKPDAQAVAIWGTLTENEQRIVEASLRNETPKEVAQELDISPKHVYNTRSRIRTKLGIPTDKDFREHCRQVFPHFFPLLVAAMLSLGAGEGSWFGANELRQVALEAIESRDSLAFSQLEQEVGGVLVEDSAWVARALGRTRWLISPWRDAWEQRWEESGIDHPLEEVIAMHLDQILEREGQLLVSERSLEPLEIRAIDPLEELAALRWLVWAGAVMVVGVFGGLLWFSRRRVRAAVEDLRTGAVSPGPEVVAWGQEALALLEAPRRSRLDRVRGELLIARLDQYRRATPTNWMTAAERREREIRHLQERGLASAEVQVVMEKLPG